jgi:uncharacterized protein (TIGR02265 family)
MMVSVAGGTAVDVERVRQMLDLDRRLREIPSSAKVRGFIFQMTGDEVSTHGPAAVATYRRLSPVKATWFFRMYSVRDYLEDVAAGAAAIDPANPKEAVRKIWRNMPRYAPLFNAERFLSLLKASPLDAVKWVEAHRDWFYQYGRWHLEQRDEHFFTMHYFDEYLWLDACHRGGVEGLLDACRSTGTVDVDQYSPFDGRINVRWRPLQ